METFLHCGCVVAALVVFLQFPTPVQALLRFGKKLRGVGVFPLELERGEMTKTKDLNSIGHQKRHTRLG